MPPSSDEHTTILARRCRQGGVHPINLGSRKGKAVRRLIRSAGAKLFFLPKYSPDLNPIEQVFAKLSICCARPPRAQSKPSVPQSARSSPHLHPTNAPTISETQATP
jgi:DDE superfamily endonuclease